MTTTDMILARYAELLARKPCIVTARSPKEIDRQRKRRKAEPTPEQAERERSYVSRVSRAGLT